MEQITTVGIDLAKNVFSLHGVDAAGKAVLRRTVRRDRLVETVASLSPCLIGMEACSGAHEWGRRFQQHGHTVRLMAPKFVAPYRKSDKNDGNDAEAVCEAVTRPSMRFVPVKSVEQQALLALHRVRQGFVVERTAIINRLRGLLTEFGVVLPLRSVTVRRQAAAAAEGLPELARTAINDLLEQLRLLNFTAVALNFSPYLAILRGPAFATFHLQPVRPRCQLNRGKLGVAVHRVVRPPTRAGD